MRPSGRPGFWTGLGAAAVAVTLAVGVGQALTLALDLPNLSMVFLLAVLGCSATFGLWSAVAASFLSFLAYNFFFIQPVHTFTIAEPQEVLSLLVFLIVAVLTGSLAGRVHDQAKAASQRAQNIASLYDFSRKLAGAARLDDVLWASVTHLHRAQGGPVVLLLPQEGEVQLAVRMAAGPGTCRRARSAPRNGRSTSRNFPAGAPTPCPISPCSSARS